MKAALVISSHDNVATALEALEPGRRLQLGTVDVAVLEPIPPGHKVALTRDRAGSADREVRQPDRPRDGRDPGGRARAHPQRRQQPRPRRPRRDGAGEPSSRGSRSRPTKSRRPAPPRRWSRGRARRDDRTPRFHGLSALRRPHRHAQPRARRADGHLRVGRRRARRRRCRASRHRAPAPGRLRAARTRHARHARHARRVLRPSERRRGAGGRARLRAGGRAEPRRERQAPRQARRRSSRSRPRAARSRRRPRARAIAQALAGELAAQEREWCDISELVLSLKCGGSDYTSGSGLEPHARPRRRPARRPGRQRGAGRDCGNHGGGAPPGVEGDPAGDVGEADSGHHPRRDGSALRWGWTSAARSRRPATSVAA